MGVSGSICKFCEELRQGAPIIDESEFAKQGKMSVGASRQYLGRLGKVDNGQVAVFGVLAKGRFATAIDTRLYLPKEWTDDALHAQRKATHARAMLSRRGSFCLSAANERSGERRDSGSILDRHSRERRRLSSHISNSRSPSCTRSGKRACCRCRL